MVNRARRKVLLVFVSLSAAFFLVGMGKKNRIPPSFWEDTSTKIGVCIGYIPKDAGVVSASEYNPKVRHDYKEYEQFRSFMKNLEIVPIIALRTEFSEKLRSLGLQVKEIPYFISNISYGDSDIYDLTGVAKKEKVDVLIVFRVNYTGLEMEYDKNGNLMRTYGSLRVSGIMQKMKSGKLYTSRFRRPVWISHVPTEMTKIAIEGNWNEPPDYPKVAEALNMAMVNSKEYLIDNFFEISNLQ